MALDSRYVDRIFARLMVRYGTAWLRMWEGVDPEAVKADWAQELGGVSPESIIHALDHLPPEKPPTVAVFRALCIARNQPGPLALPPVKTDPEVLRRIRSAFNRRPERDPKDWARLLRRREEAGERLSAFQRASWREALTHEIEAEQ
jgi:hypothetical protein